MIKKFTRRRKPSVFRFESLEPRMVLDSTVVFNELMYNPDATRGQGEWIELHNAMSVDIDMSNWTLSGPVQYRFPAGTILNSGKYLVVAASPNDLATAYNLTNVVGPMTGTLGNGGDRVELRNHTQRLMNEIDYSDNAPWPIGADGSGASLAKLDPQAGTEQAENWQASLQPGGTPGGVNFISSAAPSSWQGLILNEISAAGAADFWVELRNTSENSIDLKDVILRSTSGNQALLPASTLQAGGYATISQTQLGFVPKQDDRIFLFSPQSSELLDAARVEKRAIGRADTWQGRWQFPNKMTPAQQNSFSFQDAIVINEILYHARPTYAESGVVQTAMIMPLDATWKYNESGGPQPSDWTASQFDETGWKEGKGLFYEESAILPGPKNTSIATGIVTHYFRTTIDLGQNPQALNLLMRHVVDDGAIFYLNGQEFHRWNLPAGAVNNTTLATPSVSDATLVGPVTLPANLLIPGKNTLAIEVHQNSAASPDVVFGLQLEALNSVEGGTKYADSPEEWIELYNRSGQTVDISDWRLGNAVSFRVPTSTTLAPGEYAVVAKDPNALQSQFPGIRILGAFAGTLNNNDDQIELLDANGNLADEVHYYDGGYWPEFADGGGLSLELRNPFADNSQPTSWAGSDESNRSTWNSYTYTKKVEPLLYDPPINFNEFVMGMLDAGEILLDNLRVINETTGASLLQNGTFDDQPVNSPAAKWRIQGTHGRSKVIADPDRPGNQVLNLKAVGRTHYLSNHAETTLANGAKVVNGQTYTISFDAKWIAGSPQLRTELYYKDAAKTTILKQPTKSGTPGSKNSAWVDNLGPTIQSLRHEPVIPSPTNEVTISATAADPDQVTGMDLLWAVEGKAPFTRVAMTLHADGRYTATVPPQPHRTAVQFYVEARDNTGLVSMYPPEGPNSRALFQSRTSFTADPIRHDFQIIMTKDDTTELHKNVNWMDNHHRGATVVYDGKQVFYDVGARLRGSMFTRQSIGSTGYNVKFHPDQLFRGVHGNVSIDQNGKSEILVKFAVMQAGSLGGTYDDVLQLITPSGQGGGAVIAYISSHGKVFQEEQFENGGDGTLFELEGIRVLTSTVDGKPESLKVYQPIGWVGDFDIANLGDDKELYRWPLLIDANRGRDNYEPMIALAKAFSMTGPAQVAALEKIMDADNWTHTFALMSLFGIGDAYTQGNPHNLNMYARPSDGKMLAFAWDWDFVFNQPPNAPLHGNANFGKILDIPTYNHLFLGQLHHLMGTTFTRSYLGRWVPYFGSLMREGTWGTILTGIDARSQFVRSKLPFPVPFQIDANVDPVAYTPLVNEDTEGSILVPSEANGGSALGLQWIEPSFVESPGWKKGSIAVGFEPTPGEFASSIKTPIDEMWNVNPTVYVRAPFTVGQDSNYDGLILRMKYDDGFIAYLNGVRVASAAAPTNPAWDSFATSTHANGEAAKFVDFDISSFRHLLKPGKNLLAIHGLNRSPASNDALFVPQLLAQKFKDLGPIEINTDQPVINIDGYGWINVKEIRVRGESGKLPVTWKNATTWQTSLPVRTGRNEMILDAIDFSGNLIGSKSLIVSSSAVEPTLDYLRISELMYNPANPTASEIAAGFTDSDAFEYIELTNIGPANSPSLDLKGVTFAAGVDFTFTSGSIAPGEYAVLAANANAFKQRYGNGIRILGTYQNQLANGGERIQLQNTRGVTIVDFSYDDAEPWPAEADGKGPSLEVINPATTKPNQYGQASFWQASSGQLGSPGVMNPPRVNADWNQDGKIDVSDLDLLCTAIRVGDQNLKWDLDSNKKVDRDDQAFMLKHILNSVIGDANLDGIFNSRDMVQVFVVGQYEDIVPLNSTWGSGDWNCDGEFTTADLVEAFAAGSYVSAGHPNSRDAFLLAAAIDAVFGESRQARREIRE